MKLAVEDEDLELAMAYLQGLQGAARQRLHKAAEKTLADGTGAAGSTVDEDTAAAEAGLADRAQRVLRALQPKSLS